MRQTSEIYKLSAPLVSYLVVPENVELSAKVLLIGFKRSWIPKVTMIHRYRLNSPLPLFLTFKLHTYPSISFQMLYVRKTQPAVALSSKALKV